MKSLAPKSLAPSSLVMDAAPLPAPRARVPRAERWPLQLAARIRTAEGWQDARLCNAGPGGLMLRCSLPPQPGTRVVVRCGTVRLRGTVQWSEMGKCGIASAMVLDAVALRQGRMEMARASLAKGMLTGWLLRRWRRSGSAPRGKS